jgi:thioredoxin 2
VILNCPHCHVNNRVLPERLGQQPSCGKCGKQLLAGAPLAIDDRNFAELIAGSDRPVVLDVWAPWCGPCHGFAPVFAQTAARHPEWLFAKLDSDANPQTAAALEIRSIPTLIVFRGGREAQRISGALPAQALEEWLVMRDG